MNALLAKELRQVLPAQVAMAALVAAAWFGLVDADAALAPFDSYQLGLQLFVAALCFVEGLVLGMGQFGGERWNGTEAYLVHRGGGAGAAFGAKVRAAGIALAPLVVLPPLAFGLVQAFLYELTTGASVLRLIEYAVAGTTAFTGYALGVFAVQVRRGVLSRLACAGLGSLTLLFVLLVSTILPLYEGRAPIPRYLLLQGVAIALLLGVARAAYVAGAHRERGRWTSLAFGVVAALLVLPPLATAPFDVQGHLRERYRASLPEVVEDADGALYVARRTLDDGRSLAQAPDDLVQAGPLYQLVDASGRPVPEERAADYTGWGNSVLLGPPRNEGPELEFLPVFVAGVSHIEGPRPPLPEAVVGDPEVMDADVSLPLALSGPWQTSYCGRWTLCYDRSSGEVWGRSKSALWDPQAWQLAAKLPRGAIALANPGLAPQSTRVYFVPENSAFVALVDGSDTHSLRVEEVPLPDGDRFVALEPRFEPRAARIQFARHPRAHLVRGERGRYAWQKGAWTRWEDVTDPDWLWTLSAEEFAEASPVRVATTVGDGYSFGLIVSDAASGAERLHLDLGPTTPAQARLVRLAKATCLALPPAVALASWLAPQRPAEFNIQRVGLTDADLLRGRNRTWIVGLVLLLAAALARDLAVRLSRREAPLALRLWWCAATLAFGLPAYVLARVIEPRAARLARLEPPQVQGEPRLVIRTA